MQEIRAIDLIASVTDLLVKDPPPWVCEGLGVGRWNAFRRTAAKNSFHPLQIALWERSLRMAHPQVAERVIARFRGLLAGGYRDAPGQLQSIFKDVATYNGALESGAADAVGFQYAAQVLVHFVLGAGDQPKHATRVEALAEGIGRLYVGFVTAVGGRRIADVE